MAHSPKEIIRITLAALIQFFNALPISNQLSKDDRDNVVFGLESISLSELYPKIKEFLLNDLMTDVNSTMVGFAQTLPDYSKFSSGLQYSLALHEPFWKQVYSNLLKARQALQSSC